MFKFIQQVKQACLDISYLRHVEENLNMELQGQLDYLRDLINFQDVLVRTYAPKVEQLKLAQLNIEASQYHNAVDMFDVCGLGIKTTANFTDADYSMEALEIDLSKDNTPNPQNIIL